jgi:hypothetical protein
LYRGAVLIVQCDVMPRAFVRLPEVVGRIHYLPCRAVLRPLLSYQKILLAEQDCESCEAVGICWLLPAHLKRGAYKCEVFLNRQLSLAKGSSINRVLPYGVADQREIRMM